ncbi:hypothetical protein FNV68_00895 [Streptomyces sp. S1D4-23]|nr:hypothetical protein FNV68_00895 [Streptomyces sp. S1D4-23]
MECPRSRGNFKGASSVSWSQQRKASGTPLVRVHFALADCDPCPLRARCTKAANSKWGRSLTLLPREQQQILEERRAEQQTDQWKARYDVRAGVEGTRPSAALTCDAPPTKASTRPTSPTFSPPPPSTSPESTPG